MNRCEIIRRAVEFREPDRIGFDFQAEPGSDFVSLWIPFATTPWGRDPRLLARRPGFGGEVMEDAFGNLWGRLDARSKGEVLLGALEPGWEQADDWHPPALPGETGAFLAGRIAGAPGRYRLASLPGFPFSILRTLRGMEGLLADTILETDQVRHLGDRVCAFLLDCIDTFHGAGAHGILVSEDWGTQHSLLVDPGTWRTLFGPWMRRLTGAVRDRGLHMFFHSCGYIYEILPDLLDMGVQVLQLDQPALESLEFLSDRIRGKACLYSPVDIQKVMRTGDPDRIREEARDMLRRFALREGGLIAKDYPAWDAIGIRDEWAAAAREVFAWAGGIRHRPTGSPPEIRPDLGELAQGAERRVLGVGFRCAEPNGRVRNLVPGSYPMTGRADVLLFLGMTTDGPEGSDTWSPNEPYHNYTRRLFAGDRLGRIEIQYQDDTKTLIPVLFGVNAWSYELFDGLAPGEEYLAVINAVKAAPFREPFERDPAAAALLRDSLRLTDGNPCKAERYVFAVRPEAKPLARIVLHDEGYRKAGWFVSAITGVTPCPDTLRVPPADEAWFVARSHLAPLEALSRRLYQHDRDLPLPGSTVREPVADPEAADGRPLPRLRVEGGDVACLWGPIHGANLLDALREKVSDGEDIHTSSRQAASFGRYQGFGCFRREDAPYYDHIWTRDAARLLMEMTSAGALDTVRRVLEKLFAYLRPSRPDRPSCWQRIANAPECSARGTLPPDYLHDRENDGHGLLLCAYGFLHRKGGLDDGWVRRFAPRLREAAEFFLWQMDNPDDSAFDGLLYSESEPSAGGGHDLYSNTAACLGLEETARMLEAAFPEPGDPARTDAARCRDAARRLREAMERRFTATDPRFGEIGTDTHVLFDGWSYGYRRFAPLFMTADVTGYDLHADHPVLFDRYARTLDALASEYLSPASGRMMGYGQGFITQAVLLLDRYDLLDRYLHYAAAFCHHHHDLDLIVPEGVILHPDGSCWYRNGDLGNSVQQAEILKVARLLCGLDDLDPTRAPRFIPRLPDAYDGFSLAGMPVAWSDGDGRIRTGRVDLAYRRIGGGYRATVSAGPDETAGGLRIGSVRFGPFPPDTAPVARDGRGRRQPGNLRRIRGRTFLDVSPAEAGSLELEAVIEP